MGRLSWELRVEDPASKEGEGCEDDLSGGFVVEGFAVVDGEGEVCVAGYSWGDDESDGVVLYSAVGPAESVLYTSSLAEWTSTLVALFPVTGFNSSPVTPMYKLVV